MAATIESVMTRDPLTIESDDTVVHAASLMREHGIGTIVVTDHEQVRGIVTDRDIAVRAVAEGRDPDSTRIADIASMDVTAVAPSDSVDEVVHAMRDRSIRRVPVVSNGRAVGIVSLGDLAIERDPDSALADISSAPSDQ
jgi:CBS domain-containing protein